MIAQKLPGRYFIHNLDQITVSKIISTQNYGKVLEN